LRRNGEAVARLVHMSDFGPTAGEGCAVVVDCIAGEDCVVAEDYIAALISCTVVRDAESQLYAVSLAAATAESVESVLPRARASILDSSCTGSDYPFHSECSRGNYTTLSALDLVVMDSVARGTRYVRGTLATAPVSCSGSHSVTLLSTASALVVAVGNAVDISPGSYRQRDRWARTRSRLHARCCVSCPVMRSDAALGVEHRTLGMARSLDCSAPF
jgi:hypothetical protein